MISSMTGYGRGFAGREGREITVELKSVNHRYLDISLRLPRHLVFLEDTLRRQIAGSISRGHVDVYINYRNTRNDSKSILVDEAIVSQYITAAKEIAGRYDVDGRLNAANVLRLPDAVSVIEAEEDRDEVLLLAQNAMEAALKELITMREAEGERLLKDLEARVQVICDLGVRIAERAPLVVEEYRAKLNERIAFVLQEVEVDRSRLATEVALFADKASVDEEITRLNSHVTQMKNTFLSKEPSGRKLDFIVQELNREFNTIGSKANDTELVNAVLLGKGEVEKIREQVQNIE
ncbi:YicC family protein [Eubacteriales bacterium OttesenSCG-928-K08]|nr:YicC family protein [Eubacteriales bacterium OttesenSCG-928-K08]